MKILRKELLSRKRRGTESLIVEVTTTVRTEGVPEMVEFVVPATLGKTYMSLILDSLEISGSA